MSLLDQAKKEAKRLFNLAKASQENNQINGISIEKLSAAREIVAVINGYKNWHDYEEVLKRKDILFHKVDKNTENKMVRNVLSNKNYFIQDINFNFIDNPNIHQEEIENTMLCSNPHKPIIMGHHKEKSFFENKEKHWILDQYPLLISGSTGAGKTEVLRSLGFEYIKNNEGLIYMDAKGDISLYSRFFSYIKESNRLDDYYFLNFMSGSWDTAKEDEKKVSHSIDPLNPMLGNDKYFNYLFGEEIGVVIHAILKKLHERNQVMDIQSLESVLMLNNLIKWNREKTFDELPEFNNYLQSLGLSLSEEYDDSNLDEALEQHAIKCLKASATVNLLNSYSTVFKVNCSINMHSIFLRKKILLVLFPALEKCAGNVGLLGEIITAQIAFTQDKVGVDKFSQNIILDDFVYYPKFLTDLNLSKAKNNYIFGSFCLYSPQDDFMYILDSAKTYVVMKLEHLTVSPSFKLKLLDNLSEIPSEIFKYGYKRTYMENLKIYLRDQTEGSAVVFCLNDAVKDNKAVLNTESKYYIQRLNCIYTAPSRAKEVWVVNHKTYSES